MASGRGFKERIIESVLPRLRLTTYSRLQGARNSAAEFQRLVSDRDQTIITLQGIILERDQSIHMLQQLIQSRDAQIAESNGVLEGKDKAIKQNEERLDRLTDEIKLLQNEIDSKNDVIRRVLKEKVGLNRELIQTRAELMQIVPALNEIRGVLRTGKSGASPSSNLEKINRQLVSLTAVRRARQVLVDIFSAEADQPSALLETTYDRALSESLPYWDVCAAVNAAAGVLDLETYLEVSTQPDWTLAQVLTQRQAARLYILSLYHDGKIAAQPDYLQRIARVASGRETIPWVVNCKASEAAAHLSTTESGLPAELDLTAVHGDISPAQAWPLLYTLFPRVKPGGALVFAALDSTLTDAGGSIVKDDTVPPLPTHIQAADDLWDYMQFLYPNFVFLNCGRLQSRAGLALRCW